MLLLAGIITVVGCKQASGGETSYDESVLQGIWISDTATGGNGAQYTGCKFIVNAKKVCIANNADKEALIMALNEIPTDQGLDYRYSNNTAAMDPSYSFKLNSSTKATYTTTRVLSFTKHSD